MKFRFTIYFLLPGRLRSQTKQTFWDVNTGVIEKQVTLLDGTKTQQDGSEQESADTMTKEEVRHHLWKEFGEQIQNHFKSTTRKHK